CSGSRPPGLRTVNRNSAALSDGIALCCSFRTELSRSKMPAAGGAALTGVGDSGRLSIIIRFRRRRLILQQRSVQLFIERSDGNRFANLGRLLFFRRHRQGLWDWLIFGFGIVDLLWCWAVLLWPFRFWVPAWPNGFVRVLIRQERRRAHRHWMHRAQIDRGLRPRQVAF